MGVDVYGREPSDVCGTYYRASIWNWRPVQQAMAVTCQDLLGDDLIAAMITSVGAGPSEQSVCTQMADRLEQALASHRSVFAVKSKWRVDAQGQVFSRLAAAIFRPWQTRSPYHIDDEQVLKWTEFLRHCGGFSVC